MRGDVCGDEKGRAAGNVSLVYVSCPFTRSSSLMVW